MTDADEIATLRRLLASQQEATQRAIARVELVVKQRDQIGDLSNEHFEKMIAERRRAEKAEARADEMQNERAQLYDDLNEIPCAEIRWREERNSLREALRVARGAMLAVKREDKTSHQWFYRHCETAVAQIDKLIGGGGE